MKAKKLIAILLTTAMSLSLIPEQVFAQSDNSPPEATLEFLQEASKDSKKIEGKIISELNEKRERNIKHFLKDDMTYEAVEYALPVHYEEGGQWKDIDNSLVETKEEDVNNKEALNSETAESSEDKNIILDSLDKAKEFVVSKVNGNNNSVLENKENDFKVKFSKKSSSKNLVKVQKDKYEISWNLENAEKTDSKIEQVDENKIDSNIEKFVDDKIKNDKVLSKKSLLDKNKIKNTLIENENKKTLKKIQSGVNYTDILPDTDLRYDLVSNNIKENIILKKPISNPEFRFNINAKNLVPRLQQDKSIIFYDEKDTSKAVFKIQAPIMIDSKKAHSENIDIKLEQNKKDYVLIMKPDSSWLNSADRAYPVTIDPPIQTSLNVNSIQDTFIADALPGENKKQSILLGVGRGSVSGVTRSYIKFDLPTLTSADLITNAQLGLSLYSDNYSNAQIDAHKVTSNWDSSTLTWNNRADYAGKIEEYQIISGAAGKDFFWDITNIVKDWYSTGNNYGLMLMNNNESIGYTEFFSSDCSSDYAGYRPQVTLWYVNNSGLEDYWTYHSADAGRAGAGYVNDYNGNLVFLHEDLDMNGNKMPVNITHIFNSNEKNSSIGYGVGWRLNFNQRVIPQNFSGIQYYVYTDGDGTKHYFKKDSSTGQYKDESGLDSTLTINADGGYTIKDKKDNLLIFVPGGYLYQMRDSNGNTITLSYNGTILSKITDGTGRVILLDSTPEGYLLGITDPSKRRISFAYSGTQLTKITYPDNKYTIYNYDSNNNLKNVINYDGLKLTYDYYTASPYKVKKISSSNNISETQGGQLNITYGYNTTTFTDAKGRKNIYQFNNSGNTLSIKEDDGSAQYYKYDSSNRNKLSIDSKLQKTVTNYLKNHNAETSNSYWNVDYWSGASGTASFTTEDKYFGSKSLKVTKTDSSTSRYFYNQAVNLEKGKTYTLSSYIKTNSISNNTGKGAVLFVNYQNSDGSYSTVDSTPVNGTNNWDRYEVKFTLPSNATSTTAYIRVGIAGESGTAYFDSLQLEEGTIANRYNLIENSNMTYDPNNDWTPYFWSKNSYSDAYDKPLQAYGKTAFRFNGYPNKLKNINQYIPMSGKSGDVFAIGGWAKGDSVPLTDSRYFALDVGIQNTDGTTQWEVIPFNQDSSDWQYVSDRVVANKDYNSITVYALYYNNANTAYITNIQLYKEEFGVSYKYDSKGNVVSTQDLAEKTSTFEYDGANNLINTIDPKGNNFKYEYDGKHNITKAASSENVVYSFEYDSSGNPTKGKIGDATLFTQATSTYTPSGNYIKTVTDSSGNTVTYDYDETKGTLKSITDPAAKTATYSYDDVDRLTGVSKNVDDRAITNSYAYENDRIKTINHNGFNYSFNYDPLGNNTSVYVGTQKLIDNSYDLNTGNVLQSTYGNGQTVSNDYDNLDRVTARKYNGSTKYTYQYDATGNLGYHEDLVNSVNYRYIYDLADRLTKVVDSQGNSIVYSYDANNNKNKFTEKINSKSYDINYGYDKDNRPTSVQYNGNNLAYSYDSLGRLKETAFNTPTSLGTSSYRVSYNYLGGVDGSTTTKIGSISIKNSGKTISYTYDAKGNIETISDGIKKIKYYYNELNEVIREDNQVLNKTIVYTYDAGGNILTKAEYNYTTDANLGNPIKTYNYAYGDSNWKDKLTAYNGNTITYDAIGNPLTYDGWTFTWEAGRQLASMANGTQKVDFKYNDEGIRTEKSVTKDGKTIVTKYHLVGDKVTYENNGTDEIHYTYDSNDNLVSMNLSGKEYYYIRNAQGDIMGLFDSNGNDVVSYTYDTWGKLIAIDGSLKDTVGVKNPYRYRSYRYDTETALYYLQSRYYNPEWSRFINADAFGGELGKLLSHNIFAYCENNPINMIDLDGHSAGLVGALVSEIAGAFVFETLIPVIIVGGVCYGLYEGAKYVYGVLNSNSSESLNNNDTKPNKNKDNDTRPVVPRPEKPGVSERLGKPLDKWLNENGYTLGKEKKTDMIKKPILNRSRRPIGELHLKQPEYKKLRSGDKVPTGRVEPDHLHLKSRPGVHIFPY